MLVGPQGMIDLAAITSGIQAIQRTQASIGADLKALQASNEHLWREAMEQREKHKKHQETIDLIVSFLERLFGTDGEGLKGLKEAMRRSGLARSRDADDATGSDMPGGKKRRRLGLDRMIGDGNEDKRANGQLVEISSGTFVPLATVVEAIHTSNSGFLNSSHSVPTPTASFHNTPPLATPTYPYPPTYPNIPISTFSHPSTSAAYSKSGLDTPLYSPTHHLY